MGSNNSKELDTNRIVEIATEACGAFSKEFAQSYKNSIISKIKSSVIVGQPTGYALSSAGQPTQKIKCGYLHKIGATVKNWKHRYFVALNKADNFLIKYYDNEFKSHEKGSISCCGYIVDSFSADETLWYGSYGIKLRPYDETKRMWLLRADDEIQQIEWIEVFMNACKKSKPESSRDPIMNEAFLKAFRTTRSSYGYFGVFSIIGTECEMLEYLILDILTREILDEYLAKKCKNITNSIKKKEIILSVHNQVSKIIRTIVSSTWRENQTAADGMKLSFELSVKQCLRSIIDKELEVKHFLNDRIFELIHPFLDEIRERICQPILNTIAEISIQAYESCFVEFHLEFCKVINSIRPGTYHQDMLRIEGTFEHQFLPLTTTQKILWKMHTVHLAQVNHILESANISGYDHYSNCLDDFKQLLQNATYTFIKLCQSSTPSNNELYQILPQSQSIVRPYDEIFNEVITRLILDAKIMIKERWISLMLDAMEPTVQEMMINPSNEIVLQAQHLVASRDIQQMSNLNYLGECVVRDTIHDFVSNVTEQVSLEATSRFNTVAIQLLNNSSSPKSNHSSPRVLERKRIDDGSIDLNTSTHSTKVVVEDQTEKVLETTDEQTIDNS